MSADRIDLGQGHSMEFTSWNPDRGLNPQYADVPDVEHFGALIYHVAKDGSECWSHVTFESEAAQRIQPDHPKWSVVRGLFEPLTIEPSVLCKLCGDHGFIRDGKWVPA